MAKYAREYMKYRQSTVSRGNVRARSDSTFPDDVEEGLEMFQALAPLKLTAERGIQFTEK